MDTIEEQFSINIDWHPDYDADPNWETMTKSKFLEEWQASEDDWQEMVDAGAIVSLKPPARQEGETKSNTPIMDAAMGWHDRRDLLSQIGMLEMQLSAKQAEVEEHQRRFDTFWNNSIRAKQMWREKTGKELQWPDQTDLLVWLVTELESLKAAQGWRLDWKPGPQRGGQGTAGMRDGYSLWRDGDILFVLVELVSGECDMAIARVYADGEAHLEVDGNVWDWSVNDISWYAKIGKDALPTPPVERSENKG